MYERWVEAHPRDAEAAELLARTLSWAGRLDEAERLYQVLALGGSPAAERGLAQLAAWRGDLPQSERRWRAIVVKRPDDAEAWVGLAQVLRWTGRPREARTALKRALAADASNGDAAEQLKWVEAAIGPTVDPSVAFLEDTDGNCVTTTAGTFALAAPWEGELSLRLHNRAAAFGAGRASSLGGALAARRTAGRVALSASLGATRLGDESAATAARYVPTAAGAVSLGLGRRAGLGAGLAREPYDETTSLIRRGIVATTLGAVGSLGFGRHVDLAGEIEHAALTGGTPNTRLGGSASLNWRARHMLTLGASVRGFGYAADPIEGYFAPRRYVLAEATTRLAVGRELGWSATVDGGLGAQTVATRFGGSETQPASRGTFAFRYRPTPTLEFSATAMRANAAARSTATVKSYHTSGWSLRGRVSF